jgi:hypothetical protein
VKELRPKAARVDVLEVQSKALILVAGLAGGLLIQP